MTDSNISSRTRAIQNDLGIKDGREDAQIEISLANEEARRCKKEMRRKEIRRSTSYRMVEDIAKWMDKYFLDAILGLVPSLGDSLTSLAALPSIYVSLFKVKSVPLTLAVIFNILKDVLIGMIPFWIGNVLDFFNRAYLQNMRLIVGYVEDDKEIIDEVNRKAVGTAILIVIACVLIWLMVLLVQKIIGWIGGLFS